MTGTNEKAIKVLERLAAGVADGETASPDWSDCYQSWRGYVPKELRDHWDELPREARLIAVILADELVSRERLD